MSAILIITPKIKFQGIRFLRLDLKRQHCLAGVVARDRQEIDLLTPEQGGTWTILNETCCFWVNIPAKLKSHSPQEKHSDPTGSQRMSCRVLGVARIPLWGLFSWRWGIWSWLMPLLIPVITILMLPMIAPCIIDCLTHFVSTCNASSTRIYKITPNHGKYHSSLDEHHYKDSEAWD